MPKVKVYNQEGQETGQTELKSEIFGIVPKAVVIQQAVEAQLANRRQVLAHTKTRAEVRGGGRKPWRQKGTGRARHGSIRSPIWVGGGVAFGPRKDRNFQKKINKKARRLALFMSLSDKLNNQRLYLIEDLNLNTAKTKLLKEIIKKLPGGESKLLLAIMPTEKNIFQAGHNLKKVKITSADSLNVYDVLNYPFIGLTKKGLELIYQTFIKNK